MFKRVIIASELSPTAFDALDRLKGLKSLGVSECLLLQCASPEEMNAVTAPFVRRVLEEALARQKAILSEQGYAVQTQVLKGKLIDELNRIAVEEDFSLIVASSTEHSFLGEVLLGGVARDVIHHAKKPTLLVRLAENPADSSKKAQDCNLLEHVLFPTDFSDNARLAFDYLKAIAADGAKKVTLLHIQDLSRIAPERLDECNQTDELRLQELKNALAGREGMEVETLVLPGSPAVEIIRLVNEQKIPLVVMGSQGRGFVNELFLGSVSHNVARHSTASVLLVPAKREAS